MAKTVRVKPLVLLYRIAETLKTSSSLYVSSELAVFGLATESLTTACERERKGLLGADAEGREKVLPIKTFADWMKTDLRKGGFEEPGIIIGRAKP